MKNQSIITVGLLIAIPVYAWIIAAAYHLVPCGWWSIPLVVTILASFPVFLAVVCVGIESVIMGKRGGQ